MERSRPKIYAVIPAAGSGTRIGGPTAKQFLELGGVPVLVHTLRRFEETALVDEVGLAVPENAIAEVEQMVARYRLNKVGKVVAGGERRQDSVHNVLRLLTLRPSDIVLVHDGVRPFVHPKLIRRVIEECGLHEAAVPAVQPKDTIRRSNGGGFFDQTLDRSALWLIQTPQAFKAGILLKAFEKAVKEKLSATDEAALAERIGIRAKIVEGSYDNIKITTREDLDLGERILARWGVAADT